MTSPSFHTGLDALAADDFAPCRGAKLGVLTHQCAIDGSGVHLLEHLKRRGMEPSLVLAPEHGLWSTHQDMEAVEGLDDPIFGVEVKSLYGDTEESLSPTVSLLAEVDLLVVDLQDVGARYYTYAATMVKCMRAAAVAGVEVLVLDRPNPINGVALEGCPPVKEYMSFVGELDVPHRHGLTLGELAIRAREGEKLDVKLGLARIEGWQRGSFYDHGGLPWTPPSPNMPAVETAVVYPGLCLLEATNLSEGRGTTTPFELFGAPWLDPEALAAKVNYERPSPGFILVPACFRPQFGKWAGVVCRGLRIHVTDRARFKPLALGMALVKWVPRLFPEEFRWRREPYEFVADRPAIDLLLGDPRLSEALERGDPIQDISAFLASFEAEFALARREVLLYR